MSHRGIFSPGDEVRCLINRPGEGAKEFDREFTRGRIYVVDGATAEYVNVERDDQGEPNGSAAAHFEPVEAVRRKPPIQLGEVAA